MSARAGGFIVAADHPSLAGHFPGNPVVPGVILLDQTFAQLSAEGHGDLTLQTAKFTAPVRPGDLVEVAWQRADQTLTFACEVDGRCVLRGSARPR